MVEGPLLGSVHQPLAGLETGRIVKEGSGGDLLHDEAVRNAYLGGDIT